MVDLRKPVLPLDTLDSGNNSGNFEHGKTGEGSNGAEWDANAGKEVTSKSRSQAELDALKSDSKLTGKTQNLDSDVNLKLGITEPLPGNNFGISEHATPEQNLVSLITHHMGDGGEVLKPDGTIGDNFLNDTERLVGP